MCRDSSVGTATRNELDGTGIESQWGGGRYFLHPSTPSSRAKPASFTVGIGSVALENEVAGTWR